MNINLIELSLTGLKAGDEIGVFDSIYCVGSLVITDLIITRNLASIQASSNDTIASNPNGFIPGHIVSLKLYRQGIVYPLHYKTLNNGKNTFESRGSMFVSIDFINSSSLLALSPDRLKVYPNPFKEVLYIEISTVQPNHITCEIYDLTGKLVRTIQDDVMNGQKILVWDGKKDNSQKLNSGIYYLRTNNLLKKLMLLD
jgi:hypothetical protein